MKTLRIGVGLFGMMALVEGVFASDATTAALGITALLCALTTFGAIAISTARSLARSSSVLLRAMSICSQNCGERHQSLWLV